ncbi:transcription factor [Fusarium langsethiae]|uniref:Transcription factor n=1 Tax=Fusarium langsethiae TaxID=179993 RepID=A0A0N0DF21_FUSLA|nr:transcription factor [Fusarium langsethiae]GKU02908.1 unnamed protein product [Fusarium langsethiae]
MPSDFSLPVSNATSLAASMSPAAHRAVSPSEDSRSSNASRAPSSQDPYYSNEDIATLHAVVVAAQELLDSAPEPKPLPAAALFKAYDAILPTYGIDPDSDHHLSTFVFRVGGEQGEGSLLDKFQTILNRMGIVLEFGDNTTVSIRTSASLSPAASSTSRQSNASIQQKENQHGDQQNGHVTAEVEVSQPPPSSSPLPSPSPSPPPRSSYHQQDEEDFSETDEEDGAYEEMRKAVVSSAMNRWRSLVANRRAQPAQRIPSFPSIPEEASADVRNFEAYSYDGKSGATANGTATSAQVNGIEPHSQTSIKEPTDIQAKPVSTQSFMHQPLAVLGNAIRSTASLIRDNVPQVVHDEEHSFHDDEVPQSPREGPTDKPEEIEAAPSDCIHNAQEVHSPAVTRPSTVNHIEGAVAHHSAPQEYSEDMPPQQTVAEDDLLTPEQQIESEKEHSRLLKRASRAREIYLASKVFNHWADRTARRLERDAVARRHMIRFRYFRSWSQAPALREPTIDHMRTAVIVKKWQRAVTKERSLQQTARMASRAYELGRIQHVLDCWHCHRLKQLGRRIAASRSRSGAISKWSSRASHDEALQQTIRIQSGLRLRVDAVHQWQGHKQRETRLSVTSRRIGEIQYSFTYLREWWDQAETTRRAVDYRQQLLTKKANFTFDQWNLRARAQAFQWRREYLQVGRTFDRWLQCAEQDGDMARRTEEYYEEQAKAKVLRNFRRLRYDSSQMVHLEARVRLYLRATTMLRVFDRTIRNRRDQDKQHIKRYLMARYTQVSSARKKRNCFSAIDKWKSLTAEDRVESDMAQELLARKVSHQLTLAVDTWINQADMDQRHMEASQLHRAHEWLEAWKVYTRDLEQQNIEAWQLWAADKQRQSLKSWSIASLQQSGQAHTALEVQKKHERERRNRVLQYWKQRDDRIRTTVPEARPYPNSLPTAWPRGGWRMTSGRRSITNRNDRAYDYLSTPLETPTRWTGQPFSMSTMMPPGSMAPLREADENDGAFSLAGDEDDVELPASPSLRPASRGPSQFSSLPSTTPMAPVPSHLERSARGQGSASDHGFAVRGTPRRSRMPKFESSQSVSGLSRAGENSESAGPGHFQLSQQPLVVRRSLGFKPLNGHAVGPRPSPEPNLPAVSSKSVGAKPYDAQSAPPLQPTKFTPARRSVRIQSPRTFSDTPQTRPLGIPRSDQFRGRTGTSR